VLGDPASEICTTAAEIGARMIVVGAHGWGAFSRAVLGSVSDRVVHGAPCPVLVVRTAEDGL
jgi:nucleotide-binding universal stress UspA family protein